WFKHRTRFGTQRRPRRSTRRTWKWFRMPCADVGGASELTNQVQKPNLVRLTEPGRAHATTLRGPSAEPGSRVSNFQPPVLDYFLVREFLGRARPLSCALPFRDHPRVITNISRGSRRAPFRRQSRSENA